MPVNMIVAVDRENTIGWPDGRLPWHIKADLQRFKALTTGQSVFMGFNTFESLKRPGGLPNRKNIVLTRKTARELAPFCGVQEAELVGSTSHPMSELKQLEKLPITVARSLDYIPASQACLGCEPADLWVIGGASVYGRAIESKWVDELYVTVVDTTSGAGVALPFELANWKLFLLREGARGVHWDMIAEDPVPAEGETPGYRFITFRKHQC